MISSTPGISGIQALPCDLAILEGRVQPSDTEPDPRSQATQSRIPALRRFTRLLKGCLPGILAHARWPIGTSLLEGTNNRIKVIKRMAYGFRDEAHFPLKIHAAFPGIVG
jgi:transposase